MLNRKFTRLLTPWLTLYLLVVSVGLPLQRVYCACVGDTSLSLAGGELSCVAHSATLRENDHHQMACCAPTPSGQLPEVADHGCGHSEVIVAQLDVAFLKEFATDYRIGPFAGIKPAGPVFRPLAAQSIAKVRPIRGPAPPDGPSGRQLLVAHQTFLI